MLVIFVSFRVCFSFHDQPNLDFPVFDCFVKGLIYLTLQGSQRLTLYYTQVGERVSVILGVGEVSRLGCLIVR